MRNRIIKLANAHIEDVKFMNASSLDEDPEVIKYFKNKVAELKKEAVDKMGKPIAPKANGFLYFTCIMMHAAEAALLDDNGNRRKTADGKEVEASWDKKANGSWVWKCSDPTIGPYKNANRDIFPAPELKLAYKKWVGKPLCQDHKSDSAEFVRGIIVDTVWDEKHQRIIALCALDKETYPDLARKVASGYSADVSMGVAVSAAICTETGCHRVARVESDFCEHMRSKNGYGEINVGLSPIELSIVVNGADQKAKIRRIIAAADKLAEYDERSKLDEAGITAAIEEAEGLRKELEALSTNNETSEIDPYAQRQESPEIKEPDGEQVADGEIPQAATTPRYAEYILKLNNFISKMASVNKKDTATMVHNEKKAYMNGTEEPTPGQPKYPKEDSDKIRDNEDKQMVGTSEQGSDGLWGDDESKKKALLRAAEAEQRQMRRQAALEKARELIRQKKDAYINGTEEPTPGKPKYPKEDSDKIRDKEDKQMVGAPPFPNVGKIDGLYGDDEKTKKLINRAKLNAKFVKAANEDGSDNLTDCQWQVYAKDGDKSRLIFAATVGELAGDKAESYFSKIATKEYGLKIIDVIRSEGVNTAKAVFKGAQLSRPDIVEPLPATGEIERIQREYKVLNQAKGETQLRTPDSGEAQAILRGGPENLTMIGYVVRKVASTKQAQQAAPAIEEQLLMAGFMGVKVLNADNDKFAFSATWNGTPFTASVDGEKIVVYGADKTTNTMPFPSAMDPMTGRVQSFADRVKEVAGKIKEMVGTTVRASAKTAQAAPPAPVPATAPVLPAAPEGEFDAAGETGSAKDQIADKVRELGGLQADLEKAVESLNEEEADGELAAPETAMAPTTASLANMRITLSKGMRKGMKQAIAEIGDLVDELKLIDKVNTDPSSAKIVSELLVDASTDINAAKKHAHQMMVSFVRYAKSVDNMKKTAQIEPKKPEMPQIPGKEQLPKPGNPMNLPDFKFRDLTPPQADKLSDDDVVKPGTDSPKTPEDFFKWTQEQAEKGKKPAPKAPTTIFEEDTITPDKTDSNDLQDLLNMLEDGCAGCDSADADVEFENGKATIKNLTTQEAKEITASKRIANMTREERDVLRVKLAQKGTQFSDMLDKAHPQGGFTTQLDIKPTGDLAKVEDLEEAHTKIMDIATREVKKAAEKIQKLVIAGVINPATDFPGLIAEGLDSEAVSYWKKYWGEAKDSESSKWVSELVKGTSDKKAAAEKETLKVKVARAYELAYAMAARGMVGSDPRSLRVQAEKILGFNDENFAHVSEMVSKLPTKTASAIPEVGMQETGVIVPDYVSPQSEDLQAQFDQAFAGRKY